MYTTLQVLMITICWDFYQNTSYRMYGVKVYVPGLLESKQPFIPFKETERKTEWKINFNYF